MTPHEDIKLLMNEGLPLTVGREIQWIHLTDGSERPAPQTLIDLLIDILMSALRTRRAVRPLMRCR